MIRALERVSIPPAKAAWWRTDQLLFDYPYLLAGVRLVAAQQPKPMSNAVLILCHIGWLQFTPVPDCVTGQEAARRLLRSLERS